MLADGLQRLRAVRALLPRGGDHAQRRRDGRRLRLLQGLRDLRGRLPGQERDRDGGRDGMSAVCRVAGSVHDRERGGGLCRRPRPRAGARLLPDHAADPDRREARRARRRAGGRRVREPRERALDARLRDRRVARRRAHLYRDLVAGPAVRARAAAPRLPRARAACRWSTSTARSSRRGASSPTSPTAWASATRGGSSSTARRRRRCSTASSARTGSPRQCCCR